MLQKIETIEKLYENGVIATELEYLKICKFRKFEENSTVRFEHPFTVLVGKNGSGKSTFLKLVKAIAKGRTPDDYFFETEWDRFSDKGVSEFQYKLNKTEYRELKTKYFGWIFSKLKDNLESNKEIKSYLEKPSIKSYNKIIDIEFKSLIGAFEKNTFFDNQTSSLDLKSKADYAKRVTKKVQQSIETKTNGGGKAKLSLLSEENVRVVNKILAKEYDEIKIINHRFFSGTWGTSIIFKSGEIYSEANSGSGEFIISNVVAKLSSLPKGSLLLLDEPELSLHPGAQVRLLEYLLDLIIVKKIQVILSTHSQAFVERIPSKCIKVFSLNKDGRVSIEQGVNYLNAFDSLEFPYDAPKLIVEDILAKKILDKIATNENINNQLNVQYFSGGASSLKTSLITTFSKVNDTNKFIVFDGDMYRSDVVDLSSIPESAKNTKYLANEIKKITGINISTFTFHVDGGSDGSDESQKIELYKKYINYYKDRVYFLPEKIPEDIIYDRSYVLTVFPKIDTSKIDLSNNSKEKFKLISSEANVSIDSLHEIFTSHFIANKEKNPNYAKIVDVLRKVLFFMKDAK